VIGDTYRVIDANLNRLKEGLRTVEEHARLIRGASSLTKRTKEIRHKVTVIVEKYLSWDDLLSNRNSIQDIGQHLDLDTELTRKGVSTILVSNLKRAQEAARVLEEYSKLINTDLSMDFKNIRFDIYNLEQDFFKHRNLVFSLYLLVFDSLGVREAIEGGVDLVQFRDKTSSDSVRLDKIRQLMIITKNAGVKLIINDRPDLCVLTNASGVHLGQDDMSVAEARRIVGPGRIIGVSTHTIDQAVQADKEGADYIAIGPVFSTESKGVSIKAIGLDILREVAASVSTPVVAIGGITKDNVEHVLATGVRRIAAMNGIIGSDDPRKNAESMKCKIKKADQELISC